MKSGAPALFALVLCALAAAAPDTRQSVPPTAELAKAERDVRATFKDEYAKAKRSPADREALGRKLLEQAAQNENEPALEYVLLREARDLAASVGDTKTITAAAEKMAEAYEISRPAALLPGFQAALKAPLSGAAATSVTESCLTAVDNAIAGDDYDDADRLMTLAEQAARQARDAGLSSRVAEHVASVRALRASHQRALAALQKLKTEHNNPSLNLVAGKFYCLDKGDWERGLPLLALGTDVELRNLARSDLNGPATAAEQSDLGDRYWDAAAHASATAKNMLQSRARYWYGKAFPNLQGLTRAKIEERLFTPEVRKLHGMIRSGDTKVRALPDGVEITGEGQIFTAGDLRVPLRIDVTAKTKSTNIRLFFGEKGVVIFNWKEGSQQLWFHDPENGHAVAVEGEGAITPNIWTHITWTIAPKTTTVFIDGRPRATFNGDFAGLSGKAGIGGVDSTVTIRQFDVAPLVSK